jgi:excisionase family DNA binding protein
VSATTEPLAYRRQEAADVLSMSLDSFERYVQPELRIVRRGSLRLVPRVELERWLEANSSRALED